MIKTFEGNDGNQDLKFDDFKEIAKEFNPGMKLEDPNAKKGRDPRRLNFDKEIE
jgi:hypothetical protein